MLCAIGILVCAKDKVQTDSLQLVRFKLMRQLIDFDEPAQLAAAASFCRQWCCAQWLSSSCCCCESLRRALILALLSMALVILMVEGSSNEMVAGRPVFL